MGLHIGYGVVHSIQSFHGPINPLRYRNVSTGVSEVDRPVIDMRVPIETLRIGSIRYNRIRRDPPPQRAVVETRPHVVQLDGRHGPLARKRIVRWQRAAAPALLAVGGVTRLAVDRAVVVQDHAGRADKVRIELTLGSDVQQSILESRLFKVAVSRQGVG
jgi:hypothetical protein